MQFSSFSKKLDIHTFTNHPWKIKVEKNKHSYDLAKGSWFVMLASGSYRNGVVAYHGAGGHSISNLPILVKKNSIVPDTSYRAPPRSTPPPTTTMSPDLEFTWPTLAPRETTTQDIQKSNNGLLNVLDIWIWIIIMYIME